MRHLDPARLCGPFAFALAALAFAGTAGAQPSANVGLSTVRAQRFGNDNLTGIYVPAATDLFASSLVAGDFNGDGADDLATGMPYDNGPTSALVTDSGSVVVRYSVKGSGLTTNPSQVYLRQQANPPEANDRFGWALAACDFNADAFDDLVVGVPYEDYGSSDDAGIVHVFYGSTGGVRQSDDRFFAESTSGVPGDVESHDTFGASLACGDFDADGFDDLAVGVPREAWGEHPPFCYDPSLCPVAEGMVVIVPGAAAGLDFDRSFNLDQDVEGMNGGAESSDNFGASLAAGDFNADGFSDLAIGVPGEDDGEGQVQVVFGSPSGLTPAGNLFWSETFIGGLSETDDRFSETLSAGDYDGDGFDDLAVGIPWENLGAAGNAGQVDVLYGAFDGFNRNRTQFWAEDAVFGGGTSESNDAFGYAMASGDFDRDGFADLAIGHPAESVGGGQDGAVTVLTGSAAGLTAARRRQIVEGVEGFAGDPAQHGEYFGFALVSGDFDGDGSADLAVGAPWENDFNIADVGAEVVLYGALFADGVESGGTTQWSQTVSSPYTTFNNLRVTTAAKLGPGSSRFGLQVNLFNPTLQRPGASTYVRIGGPEAGFHDERTLAGTFFVDPQSLTMSPTPGKNVFSLLTFTDGVGAGSRTRLTFDLNRNDSVGGWALLATYFDDNAQVMRFAGGGGFALLNNQNDRNNRIDFEWRGGSVGHLTVWRTRYVGGAPEPGSKVELFSVDLPGMQFAAVNHVLAGMVAGQDSGTYGTLYLDELSFRR